MFLFTWGILAVGVASVQSQSCLVSNTQNLRPLEEPRLTDEDVIGSFRRWGYVCCRADASSLRAILEPNKKFTPDSCNGPKSEGILLQVNPTQSNVNCSTPQGYVRCEILIQGDLSDYLDRRVSCMYNPVITLTCNVSTSAATISTDGLGFLDGSVDPAWSTTDGDFILTPISEFTAVGTAVLESHLGMLFASDTHDIWGSDQWKIDLSITDEANAVLRIDEDLTVFPNSTIPVGSNQDGRTTPTLRLNRLLPFELCTLNTAGKCIYDTQLVASNPSGSSKAITIRLEVLDENDHPPAFIDFPTDTFFIDEDDVNQSINLPTIKAADGDKGLNCRIAFTLDNGGDEFRINSDSGVIVVKSPLAWSPSQSNRYVVTVRAAEVPESVEGKCRAEMFAVATLTVEVTSVRSNPITITTNPSVLTVFNYQTEEVQIGTVEVRRSGAILPSSNFTLTVPAASSFTVDAAGNLRKKAGLTVPVTTTVRLTVTDAKDRALGATDLTVVAQEAIPPRFTSVPADAVGCATPGVILPVDVGSDLSSPVTVTVADSVAKCVVITRATTAEGMLQSVTVAAATDGPCGPEFSVDVVLRSRRGNDVAQLRFTGCPDIPDPSFAHPLYELNAYGTPDGLIDVTPSRETAAVRNCGRDGAPCHCETVASLPGENLLTLNNVTGSVTVVAFPDGRLTENLYTSKVFITCRDGDPEKAHASTTILINWRPRPEFDNLTVTVPENTPIGQRLTTVHPLHQFPYTLRYSVGDGNTVIAIDPATGDVTLNRKLSFAVASVHSLVLLAFDETRPTDDPVEVMLRVTVLEEFHQAKFIDLPTAPVACGSGGVVLAIDLGTEEADGLDFEVFGQSPSCVVMISRPGATPGQFSLNVTESTGGLCGTNYTVTVIMKSARANDYAALNFTGCSAVPVPTFGLTLLEVNVHSDASVPFPLELLPPVADCLACQCELATANPFVSISNPSLGTLNVVSFPPDAFFDSQSSSAVQVVCTSATTHGVAQTSVIVHWHLVPRFTASQPMTAYVNGPSEQYLTTLHPENPNFPYALVYRPADSNVLDISVSDNGVVTLTNPAKLGTALTHTVVIQVFEELRPSIQLANVTLIINAATILVPAKFVTVPVDPVSCKGSGAIVTVDLGTESGATVSVMGDQAKCVLISPSSLAPGSLSVVVTQNASGFCGTNFNVGLVLESATSNDVASLQFIGCDATPVPSFNSTFYEIDLYPPTNASDAIPLSVPSPVLNCLDCSCALEQPSTVFSVDPTTGVLTVRQFPLHGEIDAYTTSVGVICTSGATNATVQTAVLVRWHIPPRFVQPSPVTVLDTSSTGQYLTTLHTETLYPYDLTYTPHSGNLVPTTVSVNGVVTLADPVDLSTASSYNLVYTVSEAERPTVEVGQILLVVNVAKSFRPARFADAPEGSVACSADGLTVTVELGTEEQVEVKAVGTQAKCVKVTPALITETSGKSVTITENLAGFCGAEFTVALVLEGVGPSRDTISLDFVGCTPLSAPRFPAFPLMDIYPASAPLPITVSPDVLACSACNCTFEGTPPAHSIFTLNNTNGQVTVTGFPVLAEFTPDSYTSQGVVLCRNADTGLEARRQIQVRWHPTPEFSQPSVLTVSDHTVEGTPLLVLRPDKNYPYTLQYAVDENPAVNVNINTGIVTLKSALTAGTEHPVMFRVTQPTSPVGTPATNVSMLIQIRAGFLPAKFGTSTATGECDGTDVTVSVNLGNENADDLAFEIVGDERGCVTTLTVTRNPTGGLTVAIAANQTDQCGVKFAAALVLTGGQSRDVFTVTFTGCPEPTVIIPPRFAKSLYEESVYPTQSSFPISVNEAVEDCTDCECSLESPTPPYPHSASVEINPDTGIVTVNQFPVDGFAWGTYTSRLRVVCRSKSTNAEGRTTVLIHWRPLPEFSQPEEITVSDNAPQDKVLMVLRPNNNYPYELQYTVDPNSVVKVDPDTGTVTLEKAFNASTEHNVTFRVTQRNSPVGTTVAEVPLRIRFTASFIPATFSQSEMTVACGDPDVTALVNLGSEVVLSYRIIGDEEDCVEPPTVATSPEGTQRVRLTAIQPTQCGETFTAALVLTGSQSRDVFAVTFTGCSGPTVTNPPTERSAKFFGSPLADQNHVCGETAQTLLVDLGTQSATSVTAKVSGANSDGCVSLTNNLASSPPSLSVTEDPTGRCGPNFTAVITLQGAASRDAVTFHFTGCRGPEVVDPTGSTSVPIGSTSVPTGSTSVPTGPTPARPAKFVGSPLPEMSFTCGDIPKNIPVDLGTQAPATVTARVSGDNDVGCVSVIANLEGTSPSVSVSSDPTGRCGPSFRAVITLQGAAFRDAVTVHFTGCLGPDGTVYPPTFSKPLYSKEIYVNDPFPLNINDGVSCTGCAKVQCSLVPPIPSHANVFQLDSDTGIVRINFFPTVDPNFQYTSQVFIMCRSSNNDEVRTVVMVNWHPLPQFDASTPVLVLNGAAVDAVVTLLTPENRFPYALKYEITQENEDFAVDSSSGAITVKRVLTIDRPLHELPVKVSEISRADSFVSFTLSIQVLPGPVNGVEVNLLDFLADYQQSFTGETGEFFNFSTSSREIQLRAIPPPNESFNLQFTPKLATSVRRWSQRSESRADNDRGYVVKLRTLDWKPAVVDPKGNGASQSASALTTSEIVLIVVGSLLVLAVAALIFAAVKVIRYRRTIAGHKTTAESPPSKTTTVNSTTAAYTSRPSVPVANGQHYQHTYTSVIGSDRSRSIRSEEEASRDMLHLIEDRASSSNSSHTDVDLIEEPVVEDPVAHYEEEEMQAEAPPAFVEPEEEPAPDYPLDRPEPEVTVLAEPTVEGETDEPEEPVVAASPVPPPPPPPPPPVFTPSGSMASLVDPPTAQGTPYVRQDKPATPSTGESGFMRELKQAVAQPYTVLKPLDEEIPEPTERKVRFDSAVEIFNSRGASPAGSLRSGRNSVYSSSSPVPGRLSTPATPTTPKAATSNEVFSPPTPTYSALLRQNLERDLSLRNAVSPPVPAYVSTPKDPSKNPPPEIVSPSPPVYKSSKLVDNKGPPKTAFSFDGLKPEDDGEIISHRQIGKQNSPAPPPPPPPPPPSTTAASADQENVANADMKEGGEEKEGDAVPPGGQAQSDDEEDKTAL